jgi:multiple sugar transport system permease protein
VSAVAVPTTSDTRLVRSQQIKSALRYGFLISLAVVYAFPFFIAIVTSFKTEPDATANPLTLRPSPFTTQAYHDLYHGNDFATWVKNSVIVTLCVTFLRVFLDSLAGYALARLRFRGRGAAFATVVAVMAVPGVVLLIPKFLIIRQLGIYDTYYGMIVPLLVDAAGVFIMKNFFESVPVSVEESASPNSLPGSSAPATVTR